MEIRPVKVLRLDWRTNVPDDEVRVDRLIAWDADVLAEAAAFFRERFADEARGREVKAAWFGGGGDRGDVGVEGDTADRKRRRGVRPPSVHFEVVDALDVGGRHFRLSGLLLHAER